MGILYPKGEDLEFSELEAEYQEIKKIGSWDSNTSGGTFIGDQWRKNPQYELQIMDQTECSFHLYQKGPLKEHIGLNIIKKKEKLQNMKIISYNPKKAIYFDKHYKKSATSNI